MTITGADHLEALAGRLSAVSFRGELEAALHEASKPMIEAAKANARDRLPKAGGLNERIAAEPIVVENRSSVIQAGLRIGTVTSDTRGANRGRIRHPVFGNRSVYVEQDYKPGKDWFDDAMRGGRPAVEAAVLLALASTARRVTGV